MYALPACLFPPSHPPVLVGGGYGLLDLIGRPNGRGAG